MGTKNPVKKYLKEMITSVECISIKYPTKKKRPPMSFLEEAMWGGRPNHHLPLMVCAVMANFDIR
jgi:hypothetical protein